LTLAKRFSGTISIASVGATDPCLYGCIAGIGAAAVVTISISIFQNANYGWETLSAIRLTDDAGNEKDVAYADPTYDPERLRKAAYIARGITLFLFLALFIIWPLTYDSPFPYCRTPSQATKPSLEDWEKIEFVLTESSSLYGTAYMFSKKFFTGWVIVSLLWAFFSFFSVTIFPIIEGRHLIFSWVRGIFGKGGAERQYGDEFDHHQHRQRYDESASAEVSEERINKNAGPVDVKEMR
jgi:hypothetical protein